MRYSIETLKERYDGTTLNNSEFRKVEKYAAIQYWEVLNRDSCFVEIELCGTNDDGHTVRFYVKIKSL